MSVQQLKVTSHLSFHSRMLFSIWQSFLVEPEEFWYLSSVSLSNRKRRELLCSAYGKSTDCISITPENPNCFWCPELGTWKLRPDGAHKTLQCAVSHLHTKDVDLKRLHWVAVWLDASQKPQAECVCALHPVCTHTFVWEMPGSTHHWQMLTFNESYCADRSLAASIACER